MNRSEILLIYIIMLLAFAGCSREKSGVKTLTAGKDVVAVTTVLATIADDEKPRTALAPAMHTPQNRSAVFQVLFSESGRGAVYIAEKDGKVYVVHNGKAGKQYAAIGEVALSPDGRRIAYGALADGKWRMVVDGKEGKAFSAVKSPVFSPGGQHVAYQAMEGARWHVVVDNTLNSGTEANYAKQDFNADSTLIAYVENAVDKNKGRLVVSDLEFKKQTIMDNIGLPMITNTDKTRIAAVSRENSGQRVVEFSLSTPSDVKRGPLYDVIHNLAFGPDGVSLAYDAERTGEHFLIFNGKEDGISKRNLVGPPVIRPDLKAVGAIIGDIDSATKHMAVSSAGNNAGLHEFFIKDSRKGKEYEEATHLVYGRDSSNYAYTARTGQSWFVVVNGEEGPMFDFVVAPVFSPDGKKLAYRARKDGNRFVVVADTNGKTIKQHPAYEQVFQPAFTADGKSIAYGVKDGNRLVWKVEGL